MNGSDFVEAHFFVIVAAAWGVSALIYAVTWFAVWRSKRRMR